MSKIADLLPCPFCGGTADFSETNAWWVRCNECNAETEADMSPEAAAGIWNKRTPPPQTHVAPDAAARLERILRLGRSMKWTPHGAPALDDENTTVALGELFQIFFQDAVDRALATTEGKDNG